MTSDLAGRSLEFAGEVAQLLAAAFGHDVPMVSVRYGGRYAVRPDGANAEAQKIPLTVAGTHLADLSIAMYLTLDHAGEFLKTTRSDFKVYSTLDRTPLIRLEYRSDMRTDPVCHWQFHAERGAFSHLLSIANATDGKRARKPHDLSSVHLPVGGERFRPCLEDLLEVLIRDCGIDAVDGWEAALERGRERWRMRQFRTAVRDLQCEAADVLVKHGWTVGAPDVPFTPHLEPYSKW